MTAEVVNTTVAHTEDGHHIIVDGRSWRATDPSIPETLRKQLVRQLMAARRAIKAHRGDPEAVARARSCVNDAKVALGERGEAWFEESTEQGQRKRIECSIRTLLRGREPGKTICPSEVARVVGQPDWRQCMDLVRDVATSLATQGCIEFTQKGSATATLPDAGPVRLRATPELLRP